MLTLIRSFLDTLGWTIFAILDYIIKGQLLNCFNDIVKLVIVYQKISFHDKTWEYMIIILLKVMENDDMNMMSGEVNASTLLDFFNQLTSKSSSSLESLPIKVTIEWWWLGQWKRKYLAWQQKDSDETNKKEEKPNSQRNIDQTWRDLFNS